MAKKRRKKSIWDSLFYRVYFAVLAVCIVVIIAGCIILNNILKDYESSQPVYVAKSVASLFEQRNFDAIFDMDTSMQNVDAEDRDFYLESLKELSDGKDISWSEGVSKNTEEERVYNVYLDGDKFAEFTLIPSGITTKGGNKVWTLNSVTTNVSIEPKATPTPEPTAEPTPEPDDRIVYKVTAPSDSTVTVDGTPLTANEVLNANIATDSEGMLPEGVTSPTLTQYAFYHENGTPEIKVVDKYGNEQTLTQEDEYTYSCGLPEYPTLKEQVESTVITVAQKLAAYSSKDAKKGAITQYCASDSPARQVLDSYDPQWGSSHKSMTFENMTTSNYYLYSDDCFSCHVSFDYVANFTNTQSTTYHTEYTFYFVNEKGKIKLYNFTLY